MPEKKLENHCSSWSIENASRFAIFNARLQEMFGRDISTLKSNLSENDSRSFEQKLKVLSDKFDSLAIEKAEELFKKYFELSGLIDWRKASGRNLSSELIKELDKEFKDLEEIDWDNLPDLD